MIKRQFSSVYNWNFEDFDEYALVKVQCPETLNLSIIQSTLNDDKNSILALIPDTVPFLCGYLFQKATDLSTEIIDNTYILKITKEKPAKWPLLIKSLHADLKTIDPYSAFLCFQYLSSIQSEQTDSWAYQMLLSSANAAFLPAIQVLAGILMQTEGKGDEAMKYLKVGYEIYDDPMCSFNIGLLYINQKNDSDTALYYLQKSAEGGFSLAYFTMGQIYSPFSHYKHEEKDAAKAMECFLKVENYEETPAVLQELSELYEKGTGCEHNEEKAKQYREKANKMMEEIEKTQLQGNPVNNDFDPVPRFVEREKRKQALKILCGCAVIVSAVGLVIYKKVKGHK